VASWVVVVAQSLVLFLFASVGLEHFLASHSLPTIPLVPVSSSQAVVGAVIGIGLLQGGRNIKWSVLGNISLGWLATPLISAGICFVALFFLQNVFNQEVFQVAHYKMTEPVIEKIAHQGFGTDGFRPLVGQEFDSEMALMDALAKQTGLPYQKRYQIAEMAKVAPVRIDHEKLAEVRHSQVLSDEQVKALAELEGKTFEYPWMLSDALVRHDRAWMFREKSTINKIYNMDLQTKLNFVLDTFSVAGQHGA
jgi:PiT family inorganic phosphate transporter